MTQISIDIQEKTFANNSVCTVRDLQLEVETGQFTAIVGPSGCGKSTLLNIVSGLDSDLQGSVKFIPEPLPSTGFMFQQARLLPWLTVAQNLELVLRDLTGPRREEAHQRIPTLLQQVDLTDFSDAYPAQLSVGMRQRVSLLRAFIIQPDLLLMDEPFQSLDEPTTRQMHELLLKLWRETRASVLFVTHNLREALTLSDRVIFLSARPARILLDLPLESDRQQRVEISAINRLHDDLLQAHPQLLSGQI